jgi:hypothetical protein
MRLIIVIITLLIISGFLIARFDQIETGGEIRAEVASLAPTEESGQFAKADRVKPLLSPPTWENTGLTGPSGGITPATWPIPPASVLAFN